MRRPFVVFLGLVVLPAALAGWAADWSAQDAVDSLTRASAARSARLALGALDHEIDVTVASLLESSVALEQVDTSLEANRRALEGDTVTALDATASGMEIMVLFADPEAGSSLLYGRGVVEPEAAALVGRVTRSRIGLYAAGRSWSTTDPPPDVAMMPEAALLDAASIPAGVPVAGGVLVAMDPRAGTRPAVAAFAQPIDDVAPAVSLSVRLVVVLLLFFTALAGWIQLAGQQSQRQGSTVAAVVLLATVPAAATTALLFHVVDGFEERAARIVARDLTRTLAVVEQLGAPPSPEVVRQMSGFHAAVLRGRSLSVSTLAGIEEVVESVPTPPPSFTTSGSIVTPLGTTYYVGRKLGPGASMLIMAPYPEEELASLRTRATVIGLGLWSWLALVAAVVESRRRRRKTASV